MSDLCEHVPELSDNVVTQLSFEQDDLDTRVTMRRGTKLYWTIFTNTTLAEAFDKTCKEWMKP